MGRLTTNLVGHWKRAVLTALSRAGYDLQRRPDPSRLAAASPADTSGLVIEFIGAEAVGKSTLCRALLSSGPRRWFYTRDLSDLALTDLDHPADVQEVLKELFLRRIEQDHRRNDLWVMSGMAQWNARVIQQDVLMRRRFPRGFLVDEGVFKQFAPEIARLAARSLRTLLRGRAVVLVDTDDAELLARRHMDRHATWKAEGRFKHPTSFDSLLSQSAAMLKVHRRVFEMVSDCGSPCLRLRIEDGAERNLAALKAFEARLCAAGAAAGPPLIREDAVAAALPLRSRA